MDERGKRFYSRPIPFRQPSSSSPSPSANSEEISALPHKKNMSTKRTSTREEKPNRKEKKLKPSEEAKKSNEEKRKGGKAKPLENSSGKKPTVWNAKEEMEVVKALAAYRQDGKEFPKNSLAPVYAYIRSLNVLHHDYTDTQLYEKLRRLKHKFFQVRDKVKGGSYSFKNARDEVLYKLCKKSWGKEEDEEEREEQKEEEERRVVEEEEQGDVKEDEEDEEDVDGKLIDHLRKENLIMLKGIKDELSTELKEFKNVVVNMLRGGLHSVGFSSKGVVKTLYSLGDLEALDVSETKMLEQSGKRSFL